MNNIEFKACRRRANLTQAEAAQRIGVSKMSVSAWESGRNNPTAEKLPIIAAAYGCSIDELLKGGISDGKDS